MRKFILGALPLFGLLIICAGPTLAESYFENLSEGQYLHGYAVENQYLNGKDEAIGARFLHKGTGFTLDLFHIQSVPQGFFWVNSPPESDQGEPHTCEHLLLGKGNKGRFVASLEDMSLGQSTAYTAQLYTAYPFSSQGGNDIFFDLFEAKLDAMMYPNFTDEEIRREVCNIGVTVDPSDGSLGIDEKGTVYTEMISSFEKHWYHLYGAIDEMLYGKGHPLYNNSGGKPSAIRDMTAEDLWNFQSKAYRLNNMGIIVTIPEDITGDEFLKKIDVVLTRLFEIEPSAGSERKTVTIPPPHSIAKPGEIRLTTYPGSNIQEPGNIAFAWPAQLDLNTNDKLMLDLFMYCLGGSQTSNLYNKIVNSDTRVVDIGANYVWSSVSTDIGNAVYVGISNVEPEHINERELISLRKLIVEEVAQVASYQPGSKELNAFNERAQNFLKQQKKSAEKYLNSPPGFGLRGGGGGGWYSLLNELSKKDGFKKSLVSKDEMAAAMAALDKDENIWTSLISQWKLSTTELYAVGCTANPEMLTNAIEEKTKRLDIFLEDLKNKYSVAEEVEALARYKEDYDFQTSIIKNEADKIPMPGFLANPPLGYDTQLDYEVETLAGQVQLVISNFNTMTSATVGIALNLEAVAPENFVYIPFLPRLISQIGVVKDGEVVDFQALNERLQVEVLSLSGYISTNPHTNRFELQITGSGSNLEESKQALEWMRAGMFDSYLSLDNLPRIRDVVNSRISSLRNTMKGSEESWVNDPAFAYTYQSNPLFLASDCFLTQSHMMHSLKWRLTDPGGDQVTREIEVMFDQLGAAGRSAFKDDLVSFSASFGDGDPVSFESGPFGEFVKSYLASSPEAQDLLLEALSDLASIINDVPAANAPEDWAYLAGQMKNDLLFRPEKALNEMKETMLSLMHQKNARMFIISNADDRQELMPGLNDLVSQLDQTGEPSRYNYSDKSVIWERMKSRYPDISNPTYVGLVNPNTRNGVFIFSHACANLDSTEDEILLDFLAAKLYGGGGAHSMFMKTWSAGLAYSNGLRSGETDGRLVYYAERCPDLSETMRFVVGELKNAPHDPKLADYAVAQTFSANRGSNSYESRGMAMARNLADGITPEKVATFRKNIMGLRNRDGFYDLLYDRMEEVYGRVLVGYGRGLSENPAGHYFILGPDAQFETMDEYVAAEEEAQTVYRIYPRDYWLIY